MNILATYEAFEALGAKKTLHKDLTFFHEWERGKTKTDDFYVQLRKHITYNVYDSSLKDAWNAMLLPMPSENIRLLKKLKKKHNLVLISNINCIHEKDIKKMMGPFVYREFLAQFSAIYYSHHVGLRKPDFAFFEHVIGESSLIPEETLFVDDVKDNIVSAEKIGFKTWLFSPEKSKLEEIEKLLKTL